MTYTNSSKTTDQTTNDPSTVNAATVSDNRASSKTTLQLQSLMANSSIQKQLKSTNDAVAVSAKIAMLKKDAALWSAGDKEDGFTSTKVVNTKGGTKGLFRYRMNGNIIDSFNNNVADASKKPSEHSDAQIIQIPTAVADHNLGQKYGTTEALSDSEITSGNRATHFAHGDASHPGITRENTYTWHHKSTKGKMELIDMNVHGAMWHYGGIAGWEASLHKSDSDDDPSA